MGNADETADVKKQKKKKLKCLTGVNIALTVMGGLCFLGFSIGSCTDPMVIWGGVAGAALLVTVPTVAVYTVEMCCDSRRRLTASESALQRMNGSHHRRLAPLESLLDLIEASKQNSMQQESIPWKRV